MTDDRSLRFGGIVRLYGRDALSRLQGASVCIIGVGGVGSWTAEAIARSGVGAITLIDMDDVCVTNVNRQLPALDGTVGQLKVDVLAARSRLIAPACRLTAVPEFVTPSNAGRLLDGGFDCIIDAVDRTSIKAVIITQAMALKIPVITVGGAGGRRDGTMVRCSDLAFAQGDLLLKGLRKLLRRSHGFPKGEGQAFAVTSIWSAEPQVFPWQDGSCRAEAEPGGSLTMDCATGIGSITHVTGAFGFAAAGAAIHLLTSPPPEPLSFPSS